MMKKEKILWIDDEIDLLQPYILFLEEKNYEVQTANNGQDAIDLCKKDNFDIIFLDENMPGLNGLDTMSRIKEINATTPIVMITKSEEENIMEMAIGKKISDYLIKPVNPNQILLSLKKNIHKNDIVTEKATSEYQSEFNKISLLINDASTFDDFCNIYNKLVYWDLELSELGSEMEEMLISQKNEANNRFVKFIRQNYQNWFSKPETRPLISPDLFKKKIFPMLDNGEKVFLILIDNFRFDQWKAVWKELLSNYFSIVSDDIYCSILPTSTQYARNSIFSGLMPLQLKQFFPDLWIDEEYESDEKKNQNEEVLLASQIERFRKKYTFSYRKVNNSQFGEKMVEMLPQYVNKDLYVCILNFVDMLSHARTESQMIRELASDEKAFRSLTLSWFKNSFVNDLFQQLAKQKAKIVVTTDHGTIKVTNPTKVSGDKNTNVNLRYKVAKTLTYNPKEIFEITQPAKIGLSSPNVSSSYIFALQNNFFAYPNNFNYYANYYKDTFQHGGVSMEEMLVPFVVLEPK